MKSRSRALVWGDGRRFAWAGTKQSDGAPVTEVTSVDGVIDLATRRLVSDTGARWSAVA
jgi:hypothetical protein